MASILSTTLGYERIEDRVEFKVTAKVRFEAHELDHNWLFQVQLMEEDPASDDVLHLSRHYFVPSKQEAEINTVDKLSKVKVNTEFGQEEVYARVRLAPLEAPPNFEPAEARSETIKVDV